MKSPKYIAIKYRISKKDRYLMRIVALLHGIYEYVA